MSSLPLSYNIQSATANFESPAADDIGKRANMMQNIEVPAFMRQRRSSQSAKSRRVSFKQSDQKAVKRRASSKTSPMLMHRAERLHRAERRRSSSTKQPQLPPRRNSSRQSFTLSGIFAQMVVMDNENKNTAKKSTEHANRRKSNMATPDTANTLPYKIFIPGITGKARCLQKHEDADEEMYGDTGASVKSGLPHHGFFIPGINGTPLGLKDRKKVLCHRRNSGYNLR
jgi:uncharacterized protein (DUF2147 family)